MAEFMLRRTLPPCRAQVGPCSTCGKASYLTRRDARRAGKATPPTPLSRALTSRRPTVDSATLDRLAIAAQADTSAASALLEAIQPQIAAVCRSRLPYWPDLVEEAAQDTLADVWQSLPRWQAQLGPFGGWMNRIGSRRCVDLIRAARREVPCDIWVDEPTSADASHPAAIADEYARVRAVMRRVLSRRAETVLVLRLAYDVPAHEVAALLGMTPIAVRVAQHRALSAVRAALEADDA